MRPTLLIVIFAGIAGAQLAPLRLGDPMNLVAPAIDRDGRTIVFGAGVAPDGTVQKGTNLYRFVQGSSTRQLIR